MGQQGSERRQDAWREASGPGMGCVGLENPRGTEPGDQCVQHRCSIIWQPRLQDF